MRVQISNDYSFLNFMLPFNQKFENIDFYIKTGDKLCLLPYGRVPFEFPKYSFDEFVGSIHIDNYSVKADEEIKSYFDLFVLFLSESKKLGIYANYYSGVGNMYFNGMIEKVGNYWFFCFDC